MVNTPCNVVDKLCIHRGCNHNECILVDKRWAKGILYRIVSNHIQATYIQMTSCIK